MIGSCLRQHGTLVETLLRHNRRRFTIRSRSTFKTATATCDNAMAALSNSAAWLTAEKATPFEVKPAPSWSPQENEMLVRNRAVAINPVDTTIQALAWWPMSYPNILGQDLAGDVVAVGPNVTRFKVGDRVLAHGLGMATKQPQHSAFQAYTVVQTNMASELPDSIPYDRAAVIPLGCSTAASALFQHGFLNLQLPSAPPQPPTGQTLLVWGGSTSVGSNAVQLAVAAGYEVIATASPSNFGFVGKLGASRVLDRNSPSVRDELLEAFRNRTIAGALDCVGGDGWDVCTYVVSRVPGAKFVATTKRGFPDPPAGVTIKVVFGTTIKDNEVGKAVYEDFLPKALEASTFVPAPDPLVVGTGLASIQGAIDLYRKGGVSAQKVVVTL